MVWRRLLALVSAVLLVLGAFELRARLFPDPAGGIGVAEPRIVCLTELRAACERLDLPAASVQVETAAQTLARFAEPEPGVDIWLTVVPWPELAGSARELAGHPALTSEASGVLGRSPVLLAARRDRLEALEPVCRNGQVTWRCVGDHAGEQWSALGANAAWGRVDVGLDRPDTTVDGLLTLAAATASWAGGAPVTSAVIEDPAFFAWLSDLAAAAPSPQGRSPLYQMLLTGGAQYEFTGSLDSVATPLLERSGANADDIVVRRTDPVVTADVVAVGYGAVGADGTAAFAARVTPALSATGWRPVASASSEAVDGDLPADDGLPSAAVLETLRRSWVEVSGG